MDDASRAEAIAKAMYANDAASRRFGIEVDVEAPGRAVARTVVTAGMLNGFGVCHGGHLFALADTAFAFACNGHGPVTLAAGACIDFLRTAGEGDRLTARAELRSRGRRTGVYDVSVTNQDGIEIAVFRGRSHATGRQHDAGAAPPS